MSRRAGLALAAVLASGTATAGATIADWDLQRKGAVLFDKVETKERLQAAAAAGIMLVRISPDRWKGAQRDFLIGTCDAYRKLVPQDLKKLVAVLDDANAAGVHVVLVMRSLPGCRWVGNNRKRDDRRLWRSKDFQDQAARFWRDLARALRGHPAVAAYDLLDSPHPERLTVTKAFWTLDFDRWYATVRWGRADLNRFNDRVARAIREADPDTPVIVEAGMDANPWALKILEPLADPGVLYEFHMAEPAGYTDLKLNKGKRTYPGPLPGTAYRETATNFWDAAAIETFFRPVVDWQIAKRIPSKRIFVGAFGCDRRVPGAQQYLHDLIAYLDKRKWHWAFDAYRSDADDARDYELGTDALGAAWWAKEWAGRHPKRPWHDNPIWDLFKDEFNPPTKP